MIDFNVKSNIKDFESLVGKHKDQVPYATSRAINETLKGARQYLIRHIKRRQKSNKAWWNNKRTGINRTFARKDKLAGSIYTCIWWAQLQEEGGIKTPHKGRSIAVPTDKAPKYARKSGGIKRLMTGKKVFATSRGIYRRKGSKKRQVVEKLHTLTPQAHISRPILHFYRTVEKYVRRNFHRNHEKAMVQAIKRAR